MEILKIMTTKVKNLLKANVIYLPSVLQFLFAFNSIYLAMNYSYILGGVVYTIVFITSLVLREYINYKGIGETMPIPSKKFTQRGQDMGEVTMASSDVQDMMLYVNELEEWMIKNGKLKS